MSSDNMNKSLSKVKKVYKPVLFVSIDPVRPGLEFSIQIIAQLAREQDLSKSSFYPVFLFSSCASPRECSL